MIEFKFNLGGIAALTKIFTVKIPKVLHDLRPEMAKIGRIVQERYAQVFKAQGAVGHAQKWAPLSTKWTIPERLAQGYGAEPILVRTGGYRRSFRPLRAEDFSVSVGSDDIRDSLLQLGGRTPLSVVPARRITGRVGATFQESHWVEVTDVLRNGLIQRWKDEGVFMQVDE